MDRPLPARPTLFEDSYFITHQNNAGLQMMGTETDIGIIPMAIDEIFESIETVSRCKHRHTHRDIEGSLISILTFIHADT